MQLTDEQLKILKVAGVDYGVHVESTHVYATNGEILGACGGQTDSAPCDLQPDMITPMRRAFPCVSHLLDVNRYNVVMAVDARNLRTIASIFVAIAEKVGKRQPVIVSANMSDAGEPNILRFDSATKSGHPVTIIVASYTTQQPLNSWTIQNSAHDPQAARILQSIEVNNGLALSDFFRRPKRFIEVIEQ